MRDPLVSCVNTDIVYKRPLNKCSVIFHSLVSQTSNCIYKMFDLYISWVRMKSETPDEYKNSSSLQN